MSVRSFCAALAVLAVVAPATIRAQEEDIDFVKARKEFVAGQPRATANTLLASSLGVRQQVGRCRDETVGVQLLDAESSLEKLAAALRAGTVKDIKTLDAALTKIDRTLAHHHLLLVQAVFARPRADNVPGVPNDLEHTAHHFQRAITLNGSKLSPEQQSVIDGLRKLATEIGASNAVPSTAAAQLKEFEKLIIPDAAK
jgi:hypothetical protein